MAQALLRRRSRVGAIRSRQAVGLAVFLTGVAVLLQHLASALVQAWTQAPGDAAQAMRAATLAGAATGLGTLGLLALGRSGSTRGPFIFLAVSAGTMFSAAALSLLGPAVQLSRVPVALDVLLAAALGYAAMAALDRLLPHVHAVPRAAHERPAHALPLMVIAIAAHNLPEGLAVGAGFGGGEVLGWSTALSIGMQNVPEGLIVATALWSIGLSRGKALVLATATGLLEPVGAAVGVAAASSGALVLPVALAAAGGAMVFVVVEELLPEAFKGPSPRLVAVSFTLGFFGMAWLLNAA